MANRNKKATTKEIGKLVGGLIGVHGVTSTLAGHLRGPSRLLWALHVGAGPQVALALAVLAVFAVGSAWAIATSLAALVRGHGRHVARVDYRDGLVRLVAPIWRRWTAMWRR